MVWHEAWSTGDFDSVSGHWLQSQNVVLSTLGHLWTRREPLDSFFKHPDFTDLVMSLQTHHFDMLMQAWAPGFSGEYANEHQRQATFLQIHSILIGGRIEKTPTTMSVAAEALHGAHQTAATLLDKVAHTTDSFSALREDLNETQKRADDLLSSTEATNKKLTALTDKVAQAYASQRELLDAQNNLKGEVGRQHELLVSEYTRWVRNIAENSAFLTSQSSATIGPSAEIAAMQSAIVNMTAVVNQSRDQLQQHAAELSKTQLLLAERTTHVTDVTLLTNQVASSWVKTNKIGTVATAVASILGVTGFVIIALKSGRGARNERRSSSL